MARHIIDVPTGYTVEEVNQILVQFAATEGFELREYGGEMVYKKGVGLLTAPQFMKVLIAPGTVHIEAWLKYALFPGVYVGEMGLKGFMGAIPKAMLKGVVDKLVYSISVKQAQGTPAPTQPVAQQPQA